MGRPLVVTHFHWIPWAGMPWRMVDACHRRGVRSYRIQPERRPLDGQMGFPPGLKVNWNLVHDAAIHHAHGMRELAWMENTVLAKRPTVITLHGDPYRCPVEMSGAVPVRAVHVVTPDLLEWHADAVFIPNFLHYGVEEMVPTFQGEGLYRPKGHGTKNHDEFPITERIMLAAGLSRVTTEGDYRGDRVLNNEVLDKMRDHAFVWDHLHGYFGVTTLEAWACGAISLVTPTDMVRAVCEEFFGIEPPFPPVPYHPDFNRSARELGEWAADLIRRPHELIRWRRRCYNFWFSHWREEHIVPHLIKLYREIHPC